MRIADVCAFYTPFGGGVRTYVEEKMRAAAALGHELVVIVPGDCAAIADIAPGARVESLPSPRFPLDRRYRYFADERALHDALDRWRPDVAEASSPWSSAAMVARWQGSGRRSLVMHADPLAAYAYRWFGRVASRETIDRRFDRYWRHLNSLNDAFDIVVSASRDLSRRLAAGGVDKVETIPMGVMPGIFSPSLRRASLRRSLLEQCQLEETATLAVGVGRLGSEKRWPMVIDAVAAAGTRTPIGLVIAGDGRDRRRIERTIGENPHVKLLGAIGSREMVAKLLASSDVLVHGCEAETFCMVGAEARASGVPLIMPDHGGAADHVLPGCGLRYRAADPRSLADALITFATDRRDGYRTTAIAQAARTRSMDAHFSDLFRRYGSLGVNAAIAA